MRPIPRTLLLLAAIAAPAEPALGQYLLYLPRSAGYVSMGGGSGSFTMTCDDPACANVKQSSSDFILALGRQFGKRFRFEVTGHNQRAADNYLITLSAGGVLYPLGNLYVRGGVAKLTANVGDATGAYDARGTGFIAGAGYDLHFIRWLALTPYVGYTAATLPKIERANLGGVSSTTKGKVNGMHFGVGLSFVGGKWDCVTRSGSRVRVDQKNRYSALACLNEVEQRLRNEGSSR